MSKPVILVTNDDSIYSPGIEKLIDFMSNLGEVWVVAPDSHQSGKGHAVTVDTPIFCKNENIHGKAFKEFSTSGTPADCVKIALNELLPKKPDLCVSGINHGSNSSINSIYSGSVLAYYITILEPKVAYDSYLYIFFSGFIAIIAMILPGISGAFILLLLGSYQIIIGLINNLSTDFMYSINLLLLFGLGCFLGLLSFSKILTFLFKNYHDITMTILTGFMVGSLNKIWPWKEIISTRINSKGEEIPFLERSILPDIYNENSNFIFAILFFIVGFMIIYLFEKINNDK